MVPTSDLIIKTSVVQCEFTAHEKAIFTDQSLPIFSRRTKQDVSELKSLEISK